jgi:hypothetical protein
MIGCSKSFLTGEHSWRIPTVNSIVELMFVREHGCDRSNSWLFVWLFDCLIDWLIYRLTDRSIDQSTCCLLKNEVDWIKTDHSRVRDSFTIDWLIDCSWLIDWLIDIVWATWSNDVKVWNMLNSMRILLDVINIRLIEFHLVDGLVASEENWCWLVGRTRKHTFKHSGSDW